MLIEKMERQIYTKVVINSSLYKIHYKLYTPLTPV